MREEGTRDALGKDLFGKGGSIGGGARRRLRVAEEAQIQQPVDRDLVRSRVHGFPLHARVDHLHALRLHAEDDGVDLFGLSAEFSRGVERHHARNVGTVGVVFAAGVDEEVEFAVVEGGIVGCVV